MQSARPGHAPEFETFCELGRQYDLVPVYRRLVADTLTPVSAFHRIREPGGAFLLESVVGGEAVGRYSFLSSQPSLQFAAFGDQVVITDANGQRTERIDNPLVELRRIVVGQRVAPLHDLPRFVGGAVGYIGYDAARYAEHLPNPPRDDRGLPDISMGIYDQMVVVDHVRKTILVVVLATIAADKRNLRSAYDAAVTRVNHLVSRLSDDRVTLPMVDMPRDGDLPGEPDIASRFPAEDFQNAVRRCVEYIRAGDIFQVVLSQRWDVPTTAPPLEIYRTLRSLNPSPFMFLLETPQATLVGSSPEIMCRVADRQITVRPLAGTRPRGHSQEHDERLAEELLADPKERAEHVMLVDLGRNDVGRVARYGSVRLSDLMTVERYSHVMHLTSNVEATLAPEYDAFDALMACLPAGTVSGAPKVRAMQIIDELEPLRRGPYAGAVGYFDFRGNMDTCITLRTIVFHEGTAFVQAGAGIVADSDPVKEWQETCNKARALHSAIRITERRYRV